MIPKFHRAYLNYSFYRSVACRIGLIICLLLVCQKGLLSANTSPWIIDSTWYFTATSDWQAIEPFVQIIHDPANAYTFEQIEAGEIPLSTFDQAKIPNLWKGQIWASLRVRNDLPITAEWSFLLHVDKAEVYLEQLDGNWEKRLMGNNRPRSEWDAMNHLPLFASPYIVQLQLAAKQQQRILIRLSERSQHPWIELRAMSRPNFLSLSSEMFADNNWLQGIFHGMCWMMIFFSLSVFLLRRDRTYLYLSLYILCVSAYLFFQMEMQYSWSIAEYPRLGRVLFNLALNGIIIFYALLTSHFLHRDGWRPDIKKLIRYYLYLALFGSLLSTFLISILSLEVYNMGTNVWVFFPLPLIGLVGLVYICYQYLRSSNTLARFFAITNLCLFFGSIAYYYWSYSGLFAFREIETYLWPVWIMQVGFILQMIALVLSIAYQDLQVERDKVRLLEIDQVKSRFFANISHEFRTPLTLILGPIQEMKNKTNDKWWEGQLQLIQKNARRLLKLINQILDLAKLDSGNTQLELSQTNIIPLAKALIYSFQSLTEPQAIGLKFEANTSEVIFPFDIEKIEQVLLNLLSNAVKHTPKDGQIKLVVDDQSKWVQIEISNTGPGIAPSHIPHLFERFYQANSPGYTTDQPSSGIGLALCQEWITLHGGTIKVTSQPNKITRFTIRLPKQLSTSKVAKSTQKQIIAPSSLEAIDLNAEQATPSVNTDSKAIDRPQVLIVEDNPDIRAYIRNCLNPQYQIVEAVDGQMGWQEASSNIPDLIITDVMMPKMDGFELCRQLKSQEATSHIPVIILTGKASRDSRLEGLSTQADDFLAKPFDTEELRLRVQNLLQNRARWQERFKQDNFLDPSPVDIPSRELAFLQQAKNIIEEFIGDESFSVEQLSKALALDRTQLFRKLRALTGQNPSRFIRTIRLKRAKQLLEGKVATAAEIAYMVGFNSPSYFSKCFKEEFGVTPGEVMV